MGFLPHSPGLWPHPLEARPARYVDAIGGDRVVELAQNAFDDGEFRWAATLLNHPVSLQPTTRSPPAVR